MPCLLSHRALKFSSKRKLWKGYSKIWQWEVMTDNQISLWKVKNESISLLKGLASIYYTKPNTKGRKACNLIKEPRKKSHLIHLAFPFPPIQLVCRCRVAWQKLWAFGTGSHYWKSLTHTSPGMLLMSWKTRTLAITPNNQSYSKQWVLPPPRHWVLKSFNRQGLASHNS